MKSENPCPEYRSPRPFTRTSAAAMAAWGINIGNDIRK
jgi:hypothetical protein